MLRFRCLACSFCSALLRARHTEGEPPTVPPASSFFFSCSFARGLEFRIWVLSSPSPPNISSSVNALFCRKWDRCLTISQSVHGDILCLPSPLFFFSSNAGGKFCNMQITDAVTLKCTGQLVVDESICEFVVQLKVLQSCALT